MSDLNEMVEEYLRTRALDPTFDDLRARVWGAFLGGVVAPSHDRIRDEIKGLMRDAHVTHEDLAAYLDLDRTNVGRHLSHKDMKVSELILILTRLEVDLTDFRLPEVPERIASGLLAAVTFVRDRLGMPAVPITAPEMWQVARVFSESDGRPRSDTERALLRSWGVAWLVTLWAIRPALTSTH